MFLRSIRQSCVERADSLSPAGAAAVLLSFLLGYYYWANLVRIDFATLLFELLFLGVIILSSRYSFQIPIARLTGRIDVPGKHHWRLLAFALAAIVAVRITVKLWARSIDPSYDFVDLTGETIFDLCVLPPLFEEPIFRGIVLTAVCVLFRDRVVPIFLFSSVIFSAMHDVSYAPQQVGTFCLNLITSVVALRTRSLSASILLHATFNAFGFV